MIPRVTQYNSPDVKPSLTDWNAMAARVNRDINLYTKSEDARAISVGDFAGPPISCITTGITTPFPNQPYPTLSGASWSGKALGDGSYKHDAEVFVLPVQIVRAYGASGWLHDPSTGLRPNTNKMSLGIVRAASLFYVAENVTVQICRLLTGDWWILGVPYQTIRFQLTGTFVGNPKSAYAVIVKPDGSSFGNTINVYDTMGMFGTGENGRKGIAVFMPDSGRYEVVQLEC